MCQIGESASASGVKVVDACITGGAEGAKRGKLVCIVGDEDADVERCRPVLASSAAKIVHTGALGTGASTKLCNNLMTFLGFLAGEASLLAHRSGLSDSAFREVTRANGNLTEPMLAFLVRRWLPPDQRLEPGFQETLRGFTPLAEKDLALTLAFAREHGVALAGSAL